MNHPTQSAIHRVALGCQNRPPAIEGKLGVGVLQHGQQLAGDSFLWFLAKPAYSVEIVRSAYKERMQLNSDVTLNFAGREISGLVLLGQLNVMGDNLVIFTAHITHMASSGPSSGPSFQTPLQLANNQIPNHRAIKSESKVEPLDKQSELFAAPAYPGHDNQFKREHAVCHDKNMVVAKSEPEEEDTTVDDEVPSTSVKRLFLSASIQNVIDEGNPDCL